MLGGHNSPAAAETVTAFLAAQKDYPPRLRQVIEQNADQLTPRGADREIGRITSEPSAR